MRIRKNINCLTANELHDLREAFAGIYALPASNPNSFATIGGLHGNPAPSYCIHGNNGFLSWHRAYLLEIENALRTIHCDLALPFWDWSSRDTTGLPTACSSPTYQNRSGVVVPNPLYAGPIPASEGGGQTSRRPDIDTTPFGDLATAAQNALANPSWADFVSGLNGAHGGVHVRIGGDMRAVPLAGFDPIFHLHHCNVDRLWAIWQIQNPIVLPASEAGATLQPFTRPYSNAWHTGGDFENTADWDYQYRNWCFILPPWIWPIERVFKIPIDDWVFDSRRITLAATAAKMPKHSFELRAFINNPDATAQTSIKRNKSFAGSIGVFGMGGATMLMRKGQHFDMSLDITKCLRNCVKKKDPDATINLVPVFPEGERMDEQELEQLNIDLKVF